MPDFNWILNIDATAWVPIITGQHTVNVGVNELRALSNIPPDMEPAEYLVAFDAWSFEQEYEYQLMQQPGGLLLTRQLRQA